MGGVRSSSCDATTPMVQKILLVEDDDSIACIVKQQLEDAGFQVRREADGDDAIQAVTAERFDLVLLDLTLPGLDGWEVCKIMNSRHQQVPVIIVSARSAEAHRVMGLELGAVDYLVKPFSVLELIARVRAQLRRAEQLRQPVEQSPEIRIGSSYVLDVKRRELRGVRGTVGLTQREFDLLHCLARSPGQVFSRSELLDSVWGSGFDGYDHTVNSHINRLRTKVEEDPSNPQIIETVWGLGYRLGVS